MLRRLACLAFLALSPLVLAAPPTHFGVVMGNGLLCRDETSNRYYFDYMVQYFGQPYKREGGAYWFRTPQATLWNTPILEVMVSDESFNYSFVAAIADATPEDLEKSIQGQEGLQYAKIEASRYPVRETRAGSRIVYLNNTRAKIFCAKFKPLPPALR